MGFSFSVSLPAADIATIIRSFRESLSLSHRLHAESLVGLLALLELQSQSELYPCEMELLVGLQALSELQSQSELYPCEMDRVGKASYSYLEFREFV